MASARRAGLVMGLLAVIAAGSTLTVLATVQHPHPAAAPLPSSAVRSHPAPALRTGPKAATTTPPGAVRPTSRADPAPATKRTPRVPPTTSRSGRRPSGSSGTASTPPARQHNLARASIRIPALHVTAAIGTAAVVDGVLTPPRLPGTVGAWSGSAALDGPTGEVTLAGHVNWTGMAAFAFARLAYLHRGDVVYLTDRQGTQTAWRVTTVAARAKARGVDPSAFAGAAGPRRLVLLTCGGPYDSTRRSYDDNVYVYATPMTG